jgi:hypothetical protein
MKLWIFAHTITILSFLLAVLWAIFIAPIIIISLCSTVMIFFTAERIRKHDTKN